MAGVYEKTVDRESAYEKLKGRAESAPDAPAATVGIVGRRQARQRSLFGAGNLLGPTAFAALLGLENEAAAPIQVDSAVALETAQILQSHGALEHIVVAIVRRVGGVGNGHVDQPTELGEEQREVRALRPAFVGAPAGDKGVDRRQGGIGRGCDRGVHPVAA